MIVRLSPVSRKSRLSPRGPHLYRGVCFLLSALCVCTPALAADILPQGGQVVAGSGAITQQGGVMTIDQASARMAVDWQSFSVGQGNRVTFNQPDSSSIALNRVLGSDVSVIQGAVTANGKIFLINPNGVLFTPTARVETGALVASTLSLSTDDFMAGRYSFAGNSGNAVINQGHISTPAGGTVALIAARIINEGTVQAPQGDILMGAGSRVRLDFGGPVKIEVEQAALNAAIEQGGGLRADGGMVYLTAKAAGDLVSTVINHTGVTEARGLASGPGGKIVLIGDSENDHVQVAGRLDASSAQGDGGFIETSAAQVGVADTAVITAAAPQGKAGLWLIDPTNITIDAASCTGTNCIAANTIASTLSGGSDVTIATDAAGGDAGNITVAAPISWTSNKLTLSAHNNIAINGTLTATQTGALALEYGQGTANGSGSTYTVGTGSKIYIPAATAFTYKKGSGGAITKLAYNNGKLRFGSNGEESIDANGQLKQPFYFDNTSIVSNVQRNGWFKLTFSNYPLDLQLAAGGNGTNSWNTNGSILSTNGAGATALATAISGRSLEISGFKEGTGVIVSSVDLAFAGGETLRASNTYTLGADAAYVKIVTSITNLGASAVDNVRLWVGTRDDYVGTRDSQFKFKGNITGSGFEQIAAQTDQSKALKITEFNDGQGAAILFYSTSSGADTAISTCCSFSNATGIDPRTSAIFRGNAGGNPSAEDGSYALFIRLANLAAGASDGMTWYYAAAPVAELNTVVTDVAVSAGVTPTPPPATVVVPEVPKTAAIETAQSLPQVQTTTTTQTRTSDPVLSSIGNLGMVSPDALPTVGRLSGSLNIVSLPSAAGGALQGGGASGTGGYTSLPPAAPSGTPAGGGQSSAGNASSGEGESSQSSESTGDAALVFADNQTDTSGFLKVFVVGGGVRLPSGAHEEE